MNKIEFIMEDMKECVISGFNHGFIDNWYDLKNYLKDISNVDIKRFSALQPIEIQGLYDREWLCPSCRTKVGECCEVDNFCKHCGQKIELSNE